MPTPVRLNALIVGSGWARHAARAFAAREEVRVAGVVARGSQRSVALAVSLGVPLFDQLTEAIHETRPDLAVVAVGETSNPGISIELLRAGAHVLCAHPVAPTADEVSAVLLVAKAHGLIASTDYSLRLTEAFRIARASLAEMGSLLRVDITFPGRFLPIALDVAIALAGPVESVSAFGRYPAKLLARRRSAPAAFPPTTILEHAGGVVTALTPSPHAAPAEAVRVSTSSTGGRVDLALPAAGARRVRYTRGGAWEDTELVSPRGVAEGEEAFADAMRVLADAFVDAVLGGRSPPCSLEDEAHVRKIWAAVPRALRERKPVVVDDPSPS